MKDFFALTTRGKVNRMRPAMWKALAHYDIQPTGLRLLGTDTNIILRVDTASGVPYLLRLAIPDWRSDLDNLSEMVWLNALQATTIGAPRPIATPEGEWLVFETAPNLPGTYRFCLQSWVYGRPLEEALTPQNLYKMGVLFARLHQFSAEFTPPGEFTTRRMSHYLSRDEPDVLFSPELRAKYPQADWSLLDAANQRVLAGFARRYADPDSLRVIHNDLWHGNIQVYHGRLLPFDFEDTLWGYPVQDIAMAIHDLDDEGPRDQFDNLLAQFQRGYTSLAPWPEQYEGEMDLFRAGRLLWVVNWVAQHQEQYLVPHLESIRPMLTEFIASGRLRFPLSS